MFMKADGKKDGKNQIISFVKTIDFQLRTKMKKLYITGFKLKKHNTEKKN